MGRSRNLDLFLMNCDLVKFAKYFPGDEENFEIMKIAIRIVDETKWVEFLETELQEKDQQDEESDETESQIKDESKQEPDTAIVAEEDSQSNLKEEKN